VNTDQENKEFIYIYIYIYIYMSSVSRKNLLTFDRRRDKAT